MFSNCSDKTNVSVIAKISIYLQDLGQIQLINCFTYAFLLIMTLTKTEWKQILKNEGFSAGMDGKRVFIQM